MNAKNVAELIQNNSTPVSQVGKVRSNLWILVTFFLCMIAWSSYYQIDKASIAPGEVIPTTKVKRVQHLEGGIIKKIFVKEGQFIEKNAPLLELENTAPEADLNELDARIASLTIKKQRIRKQLNKEPNLELSKDLVTRFPEQARTAQYVLDTKLKSLKKRIEIQREIIVQKESQINEVQSQKENLMNRLKMQRRQIEINKTLQQDGLTNEFDHLNLLKEANILEGKIADAKLQTPRLKSAYREAQLNLDRIWEKEEEQNLKELEEIRKQLIEFYERRKKLRDSQIRTMVRSPIEGIVKTIFYVTEGGVVAPGGSLMTIVPKDDPVVIRARLLVGDVGFIKLGQTCKMTLMSSGARSFHPLAGEIIYISPDSIIEGDNPPFYELKIKPKTSYFHSADRKYFLKPGVEVSVAVLTGYRSVLMYLLDPLINSMRGSMIE